MFLIASLSIACSTLEGEWDGTMKCKEIEGSWDASFDIAQNEYGDTEFEGTVTDALTCRHDNDAETEDIVCDFKMVGTVEPTEQAGEQDLDMRVSSCTADGGVFGSIGFGCEDPEVAEWDGRKTIEFIYETSGASACKIELTRQ